MALTNKNLLSSQNRGLQDTQLSFLFIFSRQFESSVGRHIGLHQVVNCRHLDDDS
jgi:hypothetical protein